MAILLIKPSELPPAVSVGSADDLVVDNGTTVASAKPAQIVNAGRPIASEQQAVDGVNNTTAMTPLRVAQAYTAQGEAFVQQAQAWAESSGEPGDPGTKSAKGWADEAKTSEDLAAAYLASTSEFRSPAYFGALGAGDDTSALTDAMQSGLPVDWGKGTYQFSSVIVTSAPVRWRSAGASLVFTGPSGQNALISIAPAGDTLIDGDLTLDGGGLAHKGLFVRNDTDTPYEFVASDLRLRNLYKTEQGWSAEGLWLDGLFSRVHLSRLIVENVVMAPGAGDIGVSGVRGATIAARSSTRFPRRVEILNARISEVWSEDDTYLADQDGIAIFSPEDVAMTSDLPDTGMQIFVMGCSFRNTMGRALKIQAQKATVIGCDIEMDREFTGSHTQPSFDLQTGGGLVRDITGVFRGSAVHRNLVLVNSPQTSGLKPPGPTVSGVKALVNAASAKTMDGVVRIGARTSDETSYVVEDVTAKGPVSDLVSINPVAGANVNVVARDLRGAPLRAFVCGLGANPASGKVRISGVVREDGNSAPSYAPSNGTITNYTVAETDLPPLAQSAPGDFTADALLKVGAFGLGGTVLAWPTADLFDDAAVRTGYYLTAAASSRPLLTGTTGWYIEYRRYSGSVAQMRAVASNGALAGSVFVATKNSGTWSGWAGYDLVGSGSPESVVTAPVGAMYRRTDGGSGTTLYIKESGTGNTGWVAK